MRQVKRSLFAEHDTRPPGDLGRGAPSSRIAGVAFGGRKPIKREVTPTI